MPCGAPDAPSRSLPAAELPAHWNLDMQNLTALKPGAATRRRLLAFALACACAPAFAAPALRATDAWIRWLPAGLPAGGYVVLHNDGARAAELVGASSPDYAQAMLHRTQAGAGGEMSMVHVAKVVVPAHGSLAFKPGGYHIMLMHARHAIQPGDHVPVSLRFADGTELKVDFEVRSASGAMPGMSDMPQK